MLGYNTRLDPKYLKYLTAVLGIKLHTNIILQNLNALHHQQHYTSKQHKAAKFKDNHVKGVTLAQLVKASVGQADVQRFEPHLGHSWLSCGVFLVKSRHFGLPLAQTI